MTEKGVARMLVIETAQGVLDAERAVLTVMRLVSLKATTTYRRFGMHEATELSLGKDPAYSGSSNVWTQNLVIDMTGNEAFNRKAEEYAITLMEQAINRDASVTFTVSAHEDRWLKIKNFTVAKGFAKYRVVPSALTNFAEVGLVSEPVVSMGTTNPDTPKRFCYRQ